MFSLVLRCELSLPNIGIILSPRYMSWVKRSPRAGQKSSQQRRLRTPRITWSRRLLQINSAYVITLNADVINFTSVAIVTINHVTQLGKVRNICLLWHSWIYIRGLCASERKGKTIYILTAVTSDIFHHRINIIM